MNDNNDLTNFLDAPKPGLKQIVYTFNVEIGKLVCKIISTKYGDNLPSPNIVKIDEVSKLKLRNSTHGLEHQLHTTLSTLAGKTYGWKILPELETAVRTRSKKRGNGRLINLPPAREYM